MKISWKTLLLAMIIPALVTGYLSYGILQVVSARQDFWDIMSEQSLGGLSSDVKEHYEMETQAILIGGIAFLMFFFCILTLIFYVVINWIKKRKK